MPVFGPTSKGKGTGKTNLSTGNIWGLGTKGLSGSLFESELQSLEVTTNVY